MLHPTLSQTTSLPAADYPHGVVVTSRSASPLPTSPHSSNYQRTAVSSEHIAAVSPTQQQQHGNSTAPSTPPMQSATSVTTPRQAAPPAVFTFPPSDKKNSGGGAAPAGSRATADKKQHAGSAAGGVFGGSPRVSPRLLRKLHAVKAGISFVNNLKLGGGE